LDAGKKEKKKEKKRKNVHVKSKLCVKHRFNNFLFAQKKAKGNPFFVLFFVNFVFQHVFFCVVATFFVVEKAKIHQKVVLFKIEKKTLKSLIHFMHFFLRN
jgi:hypothetical protein